MKKVIELLEEAKNELLRIDAWYMNSADGSSLKNGRGLVKKAIELLKAAPRWETPEQYKERTGKAWPDGAAVFYRDRGYHDVGLTDWCLWKLMLHKEAVEKPKEINCSGVSTEDCQIICATEAGPPPEDWKPEESK